MIDVKVLGTGCANCRNTVAMIDEVARSVGADIDLHKVEDIKDIIGYGVMATPAVVIDGKVVHAGGLPTRELVKQWLAPGVAAPCCGGGRKGGCCG